MNVNLNLIDCVNKRQDPFKDFQSYSKIFQEVILLRNKCQSLQTQLQDQENITAQMQILYLNLEQKYEELKKNSEFELQTLSCALQRKHTMEQIMELKTISAAQREKEINENIIIKQLQGQLQQLNEQYQKTIQQLRDKLDENVLVIIELQSRIEAQRQNEEALISKQKNEIDQLHRHLSEIEIFNQNQVAQLKSKYDSYTETMQKNYQETHKREIELMKSDNQKLRQLIEIKNQENENLTKQIRSLRQQQFCDTENQKNLTNIFNRTESCKNK